MSWRKCARVSKNRKEADDQSMPGQHLAHRPPSKYVPENCPSLSQWRKLRLLVRWIHSRSDEMTGPYPRGLCCHEAGHAVVASSFGVRVAAVTVMFTEEKGWHGETMTEGHLPCEHRITLLSAGKAAEEFFNYPAHARASLRDYGEIDSLLGRKGMRDKREARIDEGKMRARIILEEHREQALRLIDRLVKFGRVDDVQFLRLMKGGGL
jgi:hypothetical protein